MVEKIVQKFENSEIIKFLEQEFDVNERQIQELLAGLHDALGYHESVGPMYHSKITVKEYKANVRTAHDAVRKLNIALSNIPHSDRLLMDDYYREANSADFLMTNLGDQIMLETGKLESGFQYVSQRMQKTLELAERNVKSPGAGNARRDAKKYIAAIEMLARWFSDVFPENKLSASPQTPFYRYVTIWFQCFIDSKEIGACIDRHISNTLKHPHVRLYNVKG